MDIPEQSGISDRELATNLDKQFELLEAAYASKDAEVIDQALHRIVDIRRQLKQGLLDWIEKG
ncbi:hypothetical protein [Leisingera aquaemixtae]|uniref:Uncharacterized protein n=1 Tax=Leisingera aquaemixtae TaxID=1396826 RepID=A0A0N7M4F5_9RHOB|nr:hypothetical protein [Leisingera aquaemixtae]CUH99490.1 hypothetical protein PHA8399_01612 [Leisingera aquaemixtae]